MNENLTLSKLFKKNHEGILIDWLDEQLSNFGVSRDLIKESDLKEESKQFLSLFSTAVDSGNLTDVQGPAWSDVRENLGEIARSRGEKGFTPTETATFIFSLKKPIFKQLREEMGRDAESLFQAVGTTSELIDKLGLHTTDIYYKARQSVILRQQQEMLELSTPVVKLWDGVLALPMIGTLDSSRTQVVMESLLQKIVEASADVAIIDITGVPTVDTLVAQHLIKTVTAARLMGADCIISGIRPQIAQTIVHLGVDLGDITTKATLADAFAVALKRRNLKVVSQPERV